MRREGKGRHSFMQSALYIMLPIPSLFVMVRDTGVNVSTIMPVKGLLECILCVLCIIV